MKSCSNVNSLRPGHMIEKCWHAGGGDEGGGPRGKKKKKMSENANAAMAGDKKEAHISILPDKPSMSVPCSFHDESNHFYDGNWLNITIKPKNNCWKYMGQLGIVILFSILLHTQRSMGPCGPCPAPQSFNSHLECN